MLVGADKGGVGKTLLSRALLRRMSSPRAVDTEGALTRFYPDAVRLDPSRTDDQMRLFDTMPLLTLVDVRAGLLSNLLRSLRELGLLDDVERGSLALSVFHVIGPSTASMDEIAPTAAAVGGARHVLVRNHVSADSQFFGFDPDLARRYLGDAPLLDVPHLDDRAAETVDSRAQAFDAFVADDANSKTLRRHVRHWLSILDAELARSGALPLMGVA